MPFDPTKPVEGTECDAAEMRSQFTGLRDEIPSSATVDSTTTLSPGSPATATAQLTAGVLHFDFAIPVGVDGATGPPGEVTQSQLSTDLATTLSQTSANSNGVSIMGLIVSDPPTQAEMQAMASKIDELINALRR